jgi:uncharacterized protein
MIISLICSAASPQRAVCVAREALVVLAIFTLSACAGSVPMRYYSVQPVMPAESARSVTYKGPALELRSVQVPPTMDRLEMVRTISPTELQVLDTAHWAASLSTLSRQALTEDLASRLPPDRVVFPGAPASEARSLLSVNIMSFNVAHGVASMLLSWNIQLPPAGAFAQADSSRVQQMPRGQSLRLQTPASDSPDATALAWSQLLGELSERIAADLSSP